MNKELINKYKAEFDHWLAGGKLLIMYSNDTLGWRDVTHFTWDPDCFGLEDIIINDEYVEFRKALAEGKIIHVASDTKQSYYLNGTPGYLTTTPNFSLPVSCYSIKPDEPKFKVGDWVRNKDSHILFKLLKESDYDKGYFKTTNDNPKGYLTQISNSTFELWKPQPGEWVIPDSGISDDMFVVQQFDGVVPLPHRCEPFIGTLPQHLKNL